MKWWAVPVRGLCFASNWHGLLTFVAYYILSYIDGRLYVFDDKKLNFQAMFSPIPWYFQSAWGAESTNLWTQLTSGWFIYRGFTKIDSAFSLSLISMEQSEGLRLFRIEALPRYVLPPLHCRIYAVFIWLTTWSLLRHYRSNGFITVLEITPWGI